MMRRARKTQPHSPPERNPFSLANRFRGGDTVQNAVGVLGYDFSLYRIFPTGPAEYTAVNPRRLRPNRWAALSAWPR